MKDLAVKEQDVQEQDVKTTDIKELEVVVSYPDKEDNSLYPYTNLPLTPTIAKELICLLYEGKGSIDRAEIVREVTAFHIKNGGKPLKNKNSFGMFGRALSELKKANQILNPIMGYYEVPNTERALGRGEGSVYLFYFPNDKKFALDAGQLCWECKIGMTNGNPYDRVREQVGIVPQVPRVPLVIRTDEASTLERHIHKTLSKMGKHVQKDAQGTEWFVTTPIEVENIYKDWVIQSL